jgi:tetratricopeptide (TPR) repeat protein
MKPSNNTTIPLEAQYLYQRGLEMKNQQKEDLALVYLRQAVFIAPGFSKAYYELGNCLARLGRPEEASVFWLKASRIDPAHCGTIADTAIMKVKDTDQSIPGHFLTCLIW